MRKITRLAEQNFRYNRNFKLDNTRIEANEETTKMFLWNNLIAVKDHRKNETRISLAGWDSVTTRARLRAIEPGLTRSKQVNYINGEEWRETWFNITTGKNIKPAPEKENNIIGIMGAFLKLGSLTNEGETTESKVKYKEKIIFATMRNQIPEWTPPENWQSLPASEKLERLTKIEETI